jgi:hypothetical protein
MNALGFSPDTQTVDDGNSPSSSVRSSTTVTCIPQPVASFAIARETCPPPIKQIAALRFCGSINTVDSPPQIAPNDSALASCSGYVFSVVFFLRRLVRQSSTTSASNFPPPIVPEVVRSA